MRLYQFFFIAVLLFSSNANADDILAKIKPSLDMFRIHQAGQADNAIYIQTEDTTLDEAGYRGVVSMGVCQASRWEKIDLSPIQAIIVTNKSKNQGWVFKDVQEGCDKLSTKTPKDITFSEHSSPCSQEACSQSFKTTYTAPSQETVAPEPKLDIGQSYTVSKKTPLMSHHSPSDKISSDLKEAKALMPGSTFIVIGHYNNEGTIWYEVAVIDDKTRELFKGWVNSKALH